MFEACVSRKDGVDAIGQRDGMEWTIRTHTHSRTHSPEVFLGCTLELVNNCVVVVVVVVAAVWRRFVTVRATPKRTKFARAGSCLRVSACDSQSTTRKTSRFKMDMRAMCIPFPHTPFMATRSNRQYYYYYNHATCP